MNFFITDVGILFTLKDVSNECKGFHYVECPCLVSLSQSKKLEKTLRTIKLWKKMVVRVTDVKEFHDREDFDVNLIKFTQDIRLPTKFNTTDYSYLSTDCFHLSQRGHSIFALNLWNQLLTAQNERKTFATFNYNDFKCPTILHPYIRTSKN